MDLYTNKKQNEKISEKEISSMKKVGIITFHNAHNYGAVLQAYALQEKVKELGYETFIVNYKNQQITKQYKLIKYSKNPINCIKMLYDSLKNYSTNKKRFNKFDKFINTKLNLTKPYENISDLKESFPKLDCYITGSDQVWNLGIVGELSDAYTLNFGDDQINRVSYAASIGKSNIDEKYKQDYKKKLQNINHISVREEDAKNELQKIIDKKIEVVLDPTLLLSESEWDNKLNDEDRIKEKYILAYVVQPNDEYIKIVNYLSKKTGLKVIHFGKEKIFDNELNNVYTAEPFEFINLIKNAEYVVATSFHATVFSIIFNKKFFVIPHLKTGSRITNLLDKLEIKNRIYHNLDEFEKVDYAFETDYKIVKKKLEEEKEKSIKFLKEALEDK